LATGRIYPHIVIDALPPLRKMLDAQIGRGEARPLLLTTRRLDIKPSFDPYDEESPPSWDDEHRAQIFFPTRLIHAHAFQADRRRGPRSGVYREEAQEAEDGLRGLLQEARDYFGLQAHEPLRIACAGGCEALHTLGVSDRRPEEDAYLNKTDSRRYALDLALAMKRLCPARFDWLRDAFPNAAVTPSHHGTGELPWRYWWLARQSRQAVAPGGASPGLPGTVPLIYYKTGLNWRTFLNGSMSTGRLVRLFCAERPRGVRRSVLVLLASPDGGDEGRLDNPMVSRQELELAATAGIEAVLLDCKLGLLNDEQLSATQERALEGLNPPPRTLAPLYPL
jgi:hypothetical protein